MRNPRFYASGKRPIGQSLLDWPNVNDTILPTEDKHLHYPKQAANVRLEKYFATSPSVHVPNSYSVSLAQLKQSKQPSPQHLEIKKKISRFLAFAPSVATFKTHWVRDKIADVF